MEGYQGWGARFLGLCGMAMLFACPAPGTANAASRTKPAKTKVKPWRFRPHWGARQDHREAAEAQFNDALVVLPLRPLSSLERARSPQTKARTPNHLRLLWAKSLSGPVMRASTKFSAKSSSTKSPSRQRRRKRKRRSRNFMREVVAFWTPVVKFTYKANREYWGPKIRFTIKANREFWVPKIEHQFLPFVRKNYRFVKVNYGPQIARHYNTAMRLVRPVFIKLPKKIWKQGYLLLPKGTRFSIENVPAPIKKGFDRYMRWSLKQLGKTLKHMGDDTPKQMRQALQGMAMAMHFSKDKKLIRRLNKTLRKLRPHTADPHMRSCYRVVALRSPIVNAFNTGCSTYVTDMLAHRLTDDELAAVMAHELSHGDRGHAVKNIGLIAYSSGTHMLTLINQEIQWFLTGRWGALLDRVVQHGNVVSILHIYGAQAPRVELEADRDATKLLLRAKIPPKALITALMKLHEHDPKKVLKRDNGTYDALRDYPSLYRRVQAIRQVMKKSKRK